jgi:hypothetical protein
MIKRLQVNGSGKRKKKEKPGTEKTDLEIKTAAGFGVTLKTNHSIKNNSQNHPHVSSFCNGRRRKPHADGYVLLPV